jgi:hypothetical protein
MEDSGQDTCLKTFSKKKDAELYIEQMIIEGGNYFSRGDFVISVLSNLKRSKP